MPRGQKSKLRTRDRRHQARSETQDICGVQATAAGEERPSTSSSPLYGVNLQSSPGAGPSSKSPGPQRAPSTTSTSASVSRTKFDEGAKSQDEEKPSTSQAPPTADLLSTTPLDQKAMLVQFLLRKYNMKEPITKHNMLKYVIKKDKAHFHEILKKASELMVLAFGIDVKEVHPTRHYYVLISKLNRTCEARLSGEEIMPKTGLLMTILCVIFMKGNCATEEDILQVLNVMGIDARKNHPFYGEPKKLITQNFIKERYLERRQVLNSDPVRYEFLWGPRAHAETSKMRVLEFLAKIHDTVPSSLPSLYEEALLDEEERVRGRFAAMLPTSARANARSRVNSSSFTPREV
ncbi:melanoma-associated antigen B10-like [Pongo pygmaeus]|uniref:melanoma-associated antigen B10-like n=1 Tax=Pongo pygmaeus TaxID=9600 RepID=UPI0023E09576|nr:melanoma-associated antigen B10-like [Pongo pygmaeus]